MCCVHRLGGASEKCRRWNARDDRAQISFRSLARVKATKASPACFSCVARVRDGQGGWDYRRTCVEGPVFDAAMIEF